MIIKTENYRETAFSQGTVVILIASVHLKPSANECQKSQNKKHEKIWFSTPVVYRLRHSKTKNIVTRNVVSGIKQCLIPETCLHRNMCETKTNVYLSKVSLINVSIMFCIPSVLSQNSSLQDAKPAGHLFV